jgi:hypothetical protein
MCTTALESSRQARGINASHGLWANHAVLQRSLVRQAVTLAGCSQYGVIPNGLAHMDVHFDGRLPLERS